MRLVDVAAPKGLSDTHMTIPVAFISQPSVPSQLCVYTQKGAEVHADGCLHCPDGTSGSTAVLHSTAVLLRLSIPAFALNAFQGLCSVPAASVCLQMCTCLVVLSRAVQVDTVLALIPLTVVNSRHEVDELKELISIARCAPCRLPTLNAEPCRLEALQNNTIVRMSCCATWPPLCQPHSFEPLFCCVNMPVKARGLSRMLRVCMRLCLPGY